MQPFKNKPCKSCKPSEPCKMCQNGDLGRAGKIKWVKVCLDGPR